MCPPRKTHLHEACALAGKTATQDKHHCARLSRHDRFKMALPQALDKK